MARVKRINTIREIKMKKNNFGNYLSNLRDQHGLTQTVLAEQLELFINYLELGKAKYAKFFNVDFEHLKDFFDNKKL